eukprot:12513141-Alexandrium_andersonii.AAC.1
MLTPQQPGFSPSRLSCDHSRAMSGKPDLALDSCILPPHPDMWSLISSDGRGGSPPTLSENVHAPSCRVLHPVVSCTCTAAGVGRPTHHCSAMHAPMHRQTNACLVQH